MKNCLDVNEAILTNYFELLNDGKDDLPGITNFEMARFNNCAMNELDDIIELSREWTEYQFKFTKLYH